MPIAKWNDHYKKPIYYMIPSTWHSEKYRTIDTIRSLFARVQAKEKVVKEAQHRGFLGHWSYSAWFCNGGYMTLCIYQNP